MKLEELFDRRNFVLLDGGMGTQLQQRGLAPGALPELAAFTMPETLTAIHRDYARAGADVLLANTFGANEGKLADTGYTVAETGRRLDRLRQSGRGRDRRVGRA